MKKLVYKRFRPKPLIPFEDINKVFWNIRDIADTYLNIRYPEVPDPDLFIAEIEDQIDKYYTIYRKEEDLYE